MPLHRPAWWFREWEKLEKRVYTCPPWVKCPTCLPRELDSSFIALPPIEGHFAHIVDDGKGIIEFFEQEWHVETERYTRLKAGRYLTRYYPHLDNTAVAYYSALLRAMQADKTLYIAMEAEEIVKVFTTGPSSCMSASASRYNNLGIHPVMAYGTGDLGVAYIKNQENIPAARTMVWPAKKLRSPKVYGDGGAMSKQLESLLEKEGYVIGPFNGARLKIIRPWPDNPFKLVCPFVDDPRTARWDKKNDVLILDSNGKISVANQGTGLAELPHFICSVCNNAYENDGTQHARTGKCYCPACLEKLHINCGCCGNKAFKPDCAKVKTTGGEQQHWCESCLETKAKRCSMCNTWHEKNADGQQNKFDIRGNHLCNACSSSEKLFSGVCACCGGYMRRGEISSKDTSMCVPCFSNKALREEVQKRIANIPPEELDWPLGRTRGISKTEYERTLMRLRVYTERALRTQ